MHKNQRRIKSVIFSDVMKMLPHKAKVQLTNLIDSMFKFGGYFPSSWKGEKIIALSKHGKDSSRIDYIRLFNLLSNHTVKFLKKLLL